MIAQTGLLFVVIALLAAAAGYYFLRMRGTRPAAAPGSSVIDPRKELASQLLFQDAPVAYQETDIHGTIVRVNRRECELRGLEATQILGKHVWEIYPEDQRDMIRTQVERRLRTSKMPPGPLRRKYLRPNGDTVYLEVHERLLQNAEGEVLGLLSASVEAGGAITSPAASLGASEMPKLLSKMPDAVFRLDSDGNVLEGAGGQGRQFFTKVDDLIGKPLQGAMPVDDGLKLVQSLSRMRTIREIVSCEFTTAVAGKSEAFEVRLCPAGDGEALAVVRRITDRKEAEAQLEQEGRELRQENVELARALEHAREATLIKSRFLANMSHAIRTPMNGILGMVEFLMATRLTEDQREYAKSMQNSAGSLLTLINDMLDVSKIEAGRMKLERIPFDLTLTVEEVTAASAARARAKGLEFVCSMSPDVPNDLMGDPGRLRQVLNNLIDNAIKFTPRGRVSIRTEKVGETDERITVGFLVQDSGMGISEERQSRLFDGGAEAETSATRKYTGAGLGLVISKQLVEMMGGEIGVRSVEGRGTTFYFTAVFAKAPAIVPVAETQVAVRLEDRNLEGVGVVLVAPKAAVTEPVCRMLQAWNCPFVHAASIEELTALLGSTIIPKAVLRIGLIDIDIPGMDVTEISGALKYDLGLKDLQMIAVTSVPLRGDGDRLRQVGYVGYLNKPLASNVLHGVMLEVLQLKDRAGLAVGPTPLVTRHSINQTGQWGSSNGQPRILLVEDNAINQRVALKLLQKLGLKADVASSGRQALDALDRGPYDLILMDCQMPEMDGYAATAEIRKREGDARHTPICAITANALAGDRDKCLAAGMDDYVSKPISLPDLQSALERLLKEQKQPELVSSHPHG
ncbi:MAG: response regulator [Bryobacteraceae bacterium]|nr:response regulator [Bryobacteraceae bacterium]